MLPLNFVVCVQSTAFEDYSGRTRSTSGLAPSPGRLFGFLQGPNLIVFFRVLIVFVDTDVQRGCIFLFAGSVVLSPTEGLMWHTSHQRPSEEEFRLLLSAD